VPRADCRRGRQDGGGPRPVRAPAGA
jgi:hypothetical protein